MKTTTFLALLLLCTFLCSGQEDSLRSWSTTPEELGWKTGDSWTVSVEHYRTSATDGSRPYRPYTGQVTARFELDFCISGTELGEGSDTLLVLRVTPSASWNNYAAPWGSQYYDEEMIQTGSLQIDFDLLIRKSDGMTEILRIYQLDRDTGERQQVLFDMSLGSAGCDPVSFPRNGMFQPNYVRPFPMAWYPKTNWGISGFKKSGYPATVDTSEADYIISNYSVSDTLVREMRYSKGGKARDWSMASLTKLSFVKGDPWWCEFEYTQMFREGVWIRGRLIRDED